MGVNSFVFATVVCLADWAAPGRAVVLSEVHYRPPAELDKALEFIEVHNSGAGAVELAGWELSGGIRFRFPAGAVLPAGGRVVVARNVAVFRETFGVGPQGVFGDYDGSLGNGGDTIVLTDGFRAYVDSLVYDDDPPWPGEPDGDGRSLQRVCASAPTSDASNWVGVEPTPLAANPAAACPLPPRPAPRIVISELFYHPPKPDAFIAVDDDGEALEFIEIHNPGAASVSLRDWAFDRGVSFTFGDVSLAPNGYLVVARDPDALRARFGIGNVVGPYTGALGNAGERVSLTDAQGALIDSVLYADAGLWPYGADGEGRSLERIVLSGAGDDPANWAGGRVRENVYHPLTAVGRVRGTPSENIVLHADGNAEFIIDNVSLVDLAEPERELIPNGGFESGLDGWTLAGNAATSEWTSDGGVDGGGALRLIGTGPCAFGQCGVANGAILRLPERPNRDGEFRLRVEAKLVRGRASAFAAGVFGGVSVRFEVLTSPGEENNAASASAPPAITHVGRFPEQPTPRDPVWVTARVTPRSAGARPLDVVLLHNNGVAGIGPTVEAVMSDDGAHRDGLAGDGVFGVELPPYPHNTQLRFRILAAQDGLLAQSPIVLGDEPLPYEVWGYYVDGKSVGSPLDVFHILLDGVNGEDYRAVNASLNCSTLMPGSFVYRGELYPDVGVRFRGNTMCVVKKRCFKIRFNQGRSFRGLRKLNLNSMWTDKSLVREHLAWEFLKEIGLPYSTTEFVRLHVSGSYYGLFICLEHPDERFLERTGLDPDGMLYKALQPGSNGAPIGVSLAPPADPGDCVNLPEGRCRYDGFWEEETREERDYADIARFIDEMHADANRADGPTVAFWQERSLEDMIVGYQVGQVILNNIDSFAKNHFLYRDTRAERWGFLTWDLDLSYGKFFTFCAVDREAGREVGTLNDILLCNPQPGVGCRVPPQLDPWFTTTVGVDIQPLNYLVEFFFTAGGGYYQRAYLTRLWDVLQEKYHGRLHEERLADLMALLAEEVVEDHERWGRYPTNVPGFPEDMAANVEIVKDQIDCHGDFLRNFIRARYPAIPEHPRLKITEIMYQPPLGDQQLEYVEIVNTDDEVIDLAGWSLDGGIRFVFPTGSTVAPGVPFVIARSPADFGRIFPTGTFPLFGPYEGQLDDRGDEVLLRDPGEGDYPATIDYVRYEDGGDWPELVGGQSIELIEVAATTDNDRGIAWRASPPGGSPGGSGDTLFRRGDFATDAIINLTDAVSLLNYLFLEGPAPACLDSGDVDDTGALNLTDAVLLLNYLFLEGPPPAAPHPNPGTDPTADGLACGAAPRA